MLGRFFTTTELSCTLGAVAFIKWFINFPLHFICKKIAKGVCNYFRIMFLVPFIVMAEGVILFGIAFLFGTSLFLMLFSTCSLRSLLPCSSVPSFLCLKAVYIIFFASLYIFLRLWLFLLPYNQGFSNFHIMSNPTSAINIE